MSVGLKATTLLDSVQLTAPEVVGSSAVVVTAGSLVVSSVLVLLLSFVPVASGLA